MLLIARTEPFVFSEDTILSLHRLFYCGIDADEAGKHRSHQVFITGTEYIPPTAGEVPVLMAELVAELNAKSTKLHPVRLAALAHRRLVDIHPFTDGNGRTARLLMNLFLVNKGYQIVSIPPIQRTEYIGALIMAQNSNGSDDEAFLRLIAECEIEAQKDYCRMFRIEPPKKSKTRER
ncbi:MAG: Fic family protein [Coriobacteriales bacterium]|jgi:Fic family protein|nr:Fic family protein [Coriobacteriales bacterium]